MRVQEVLVDLGVLDDLGIHLSQVDLLDQQDQGFQQCLHRVDQLDLVDQLLPLARKVQKAQLVLLALKGLEYL